MNLKKLNLKKKEGTLRKIHNMQLPIFKLLSQLHSKNKRKWWQCERVASYKPHDLKIYVLKSWRKQLLSFLPLRNFFLLKALYVINFSEFSSKFTPLHCYHLNDYEQPIVWDLEMHHDALMRWCHAGINFWEFYLVDMQHRFTR